MVEDYVYTYLMALLHRVMPRDLYLTIQDGHNCYSPMEVTNI